MKLYLTSGLMAIMFLLGSADLWAAQACTRTADIMRRACSFDVRDDLNEAIAVCINMRDRDERAECLAEAREERLEGLDECKAQRRARRQLCNIIGEAPYDMADIWAAENFVHPDDINSGNANPWFDLTPGSSQTYFGDGETITVLVTDEIKLINGVHCRTVNDLVTEDGLDVEDTDDWYAQDTDGNVWYCGEISENFEFYEGDEPEAAELVDIDGSWKAFRDGAQPGILFFADGAANVGRTYRQEVAWGDAEDVGKILTVSAPGMLPDDECEDEDVTAAVAEFLSERCVEEGAEAGHCMVTLEYTPIEPDASAHKYYAPGVGLLAEVEDGACIALQGVIDEDDGDD
ncbi:hypothetical protein G8764_15240 [Pseudomaricurvus alcaniphilus]|uniref:hypothetical protein n=1 Tax=Pseudomaricurvus alcaniphilus TaxID=1166482 RepID=UPI00140878A4|nr:hypothetical protein [Pseudomaricurvus alcaniphilus]NHN38663.1 hypothetical protein [Pseudomaricurvus alcaniphilus]